MSLYSSSEDLFCTAGFALLRVLAHPLELRGGKEGNVTGAEDKVQEFLEANEPIFVCV